MPLPLAALAIGSAVASAGANVLGQSMTSRSNTRTAQELQQQQNNFNAHENNVAWQRAVSQWNRENAYNSPEAQMQRYKEAGLNPNLIYGQSNVSASSPSVPVTSAQHGGISKIADYGNLGFPSNPALQYQDMRQSELQMELMSQQIDTQKALEQNYKSLAFLNAMRGDKEFSYKPYWSKNAEYDNTAKKLHNSYLQQQINDLIFTNQELNPLKSTALSLSNARSSQVYNFHSEIDPLYVKEKTAQIGKLVQETSFLRERIKEVQINNEFSPLEKKWKIRNLIDQSSLRELDEKYKYQLMKLADKKVWNLEDAYKFLFSLPASIFGNVR